MEKASPESENILVNNHAARKYSTTIQCQEGNFAIKL